MVKTRALKCQKRNPRKTEAFRGKLTLLALGELGRATGSLEALLLAHPVRRVPPREAPGAICPARGN